MKTSKLFILFYLVVNIGCITITEQMFLVPSKEINMNISISQSFISETLVFQSHDGLALNGLYLKAKSKPKAIIILLRGNFGNMFSDEWINIYNSFSDQNVDIFTFDYRGFGNSEGIPSVDGIIKDSESAVEYLFNNYTTEVPVFLFGLSLGSLPAIKLAQNENINGLILEGAFSSAKDVVNYYQHKHWYVKFRLDNNLEFDSVNEIRTYLKPMLVLVDINDKALPAGMSQRLYSNAGSVNKQMVFFKNSGHCEASIRELDLFQSTIDNFINNSSGVSQNAL
ncbi:MAG: alpha/beta hydrolase [FCB group bacterium]|nr:alpha/beta hydrolase [FCB group bacterium]